MFLLQAAIEDFKNEYHSNCSVLSWDIILQCQSCNRGPCKIFSQKSLLNLEPSGQDVDMRAGFCGIVLEMTVFFREHTVFRVSLSLNETTEAASETDFTANIHCT